MHSILALDFGEKRIGSALTDSATNIPLSYATIQVKNQAQVLEEILNIVKKENVKEIVVGLPLNREGQDTQKTKAVRAFIEALQAVVTVPVEKIDERFTSRMSVVNGMVKSERAEGIIDRRAAQMILERYLAKVKVRKDVK